MNPVELAHYPFMASLNNFTGNGSVLSPKICLPKETKYMNLKAFNMIKNKDEAKAMIEHISCDCKCKFNSKTCNSNQKWNNKTNQYEYKHYCKCKKDYSWNLAHEPHMSKTDQLIQFVLPNDISTLWV